MKKQNWYEERYKAIQLYREGNSFIKILQLLKRSKGWLSKWLNRFKINGVKGLKDESRSPKKIRRKVSDYLVKKILAIRNELESHKTHCSKFSGIGAEVICWELEKRKVHDIPSIPTIERILSRHGKTGKIKARRNNNNQPYPYIKVKKMGYLYQTDIVGPRYISGPKGITRFYSFHTVDVAGHTVFASQFTDKQTISLCKHLVETWRFMSIPVVSQMDNEMSATGGGRYSYSISQLIRLHLIMGIHLVFIPQGEPGRNASIESFNGLWQDRVLRRHTCLTMRNIRKTSKQFLQYYHYEKPNRNLTQEKHETRFPGVLKDNLWKSLVHLPKGFSIDKYINFHGHLNFPIAKGKISFIRKVDSHGNIDVNGSTYFIRKKFEGQYIVATIFTHRKRLVIKQDHRVIKSFSFPIKGHIVSPLIIFTKQKKQN